MRHPRRPTLFPYTTLFRSVAAAQGAQVAREVERLLQGFLAPVGGKLAARMSKFDLPLDTLDRKSTRLNSSHLGISYAVFCLKKKKIGNFRCQYTIFSSSES